jgi:hypothetical protein
VVDRIADVVEAPLDTAKASSDDELTASCIIQNRVTDLLNLRSLIRRVDPSLLTEPELAVV